MKQQKTRNWQNDIHFSNIPNDLTIASASLNDLMTFSTSFIRASHHQQDPYERIANLANNGTLQEWQDRLKELWYGKIA